ncbi:hypothetical protein FRC03_005629 [Tulasnella sp. 419]|nr:hypothetical protein FRC03_005629 [Tulasnella sp. 419]
MKLSPTFVTIATLLNTLGVLALPEWSLCGGIVFTGTEKCDPGLTCMYQNDFYHQCLYPQKFKYYGVNESGAESSPDKLGLVKLIHTL